jgi:sialate O-acetylesterase
MSTFLTRVRILFLLLSCTSTFAQVKLPKLISDGMVLQRDSPVRIWGWAASNEPVALRFLDSTYTTTAGAGGDWSIILPGMKAGGPYRMEINASNAVVVNDIMIGEVWLCSGQSNMELTMKTVSPIYGAEIAHSENPYIRQFYVPQTYNFNAPQKDLPTGIWKTASIETVPAFSAVAYFFGKALYDKYKVPIGLINASLGGSPAESWMSEEALKAFPDLYQEAQRFKDSSLVEKIQSEDRARIQAWYTFLRKKDQGYADPQNVWYDPALNTSDWPTMKIPGYWASTTLGNVNGVVWFRRKFDLPSSMAGKEATLILGRIVDADSVFINGMFVGTTSYQYPPRRYAMPVNILRGGENTIVVRVINSSGQGGFVPDKAYEIAIQDTMFDLRGEWQYRLGTTMEPLAGETFIRWKPLGLYNAMISPLLNYRIEGVAWYQGESNAETPVEYRELLPALIRDWRNHWEEGEFPFLVVQLPNFMGAKSEPSESNWAMLREAQSNALALPNTGIVVTVDIGEWNDIHPLDKKDVGDRLALAAQKVAYGDEHVISSGPLYQSMRIEGNTIVLTFTNTGGGLIAKGGELKCFAIAGSDKKFVWANAKIKNGNVIVSSSNVLNPVAVRYAWADNPEGANLYNKEGLPASPFRTDE